jgi:carboxypeptidase C (cathepsin A)
MPLFITGESYAGKYVPAIAAYILSKRNATKFLTGLKGIAIGDGFTEPGDTLREMGSFASMMSLLDNQERGKVEQMIIRGQLQARARDWRGYHDTFNQVLDRISAKAGGINVYNIRLFGDYNTDLIRQFF